MIKNSKILVFGVALLTLTAPCVADEETDKTRTKEKVCVNSRGIRSFDGLSDQHVFIEERSKTYYLMTMTQRCFGLRNANGIAIKDTTSRVCSNGFGDIKYRDPGMGIRSCRINTIESVESKDQAKALIAERKAAKDKED
jgi:hypothetical protein